MKDCLDRLDCARTRAALEVYDEGRAARDAAWYAAETDEAVCACLAANKAAADLVREAFALDTADRNSRGNAFLVHPDDEWLRRTVALVEGVV